MSLKVKRGLIKAFCYLVSFTGMALILAFQYVTEKNPSPLHVKILIPALLGLLIAFLVFYKQIKTKINRKLQSIDTAKELGVKGSTGSIVSNILEVIGVVVPLLLIAGIFIIGGEYLIRTGYVLLELLGMFLVIVLGNIAADALTRKELIKQEAEASEALADKVAEKLKDLPSKYE